MAEPLLNQLYELLQAELKAERLEKVPKTLYKDVATQVKAIRNGANATEKNVISMLTAREREMLFRLAKRLLEVRVRKISRSLDEVNGANLTPEEKYVTEPTSLSTKRFQKVSRAIWNGQTAVLDSVAESVASRYVIVRFLQPSPATVGTDLARYGPFEKEDVAVLPLENAKPLLKQGIVTEVWVED